MSEEQSKPASDEEPFFLTILPFAGLGLILLFAAVWNYIPGWGAPTLDEDPSLTVIERWERQKERDIPIEPGRDFVKGPEDAAVTLVEFSDFECPYCAAAARTVRDVLEKYPNDVRVAFKNFPLDKACNELMSQPLHASACRAAVIARCAGKQRPELFWEVHDGFFRQAGLTEEVLLGVPRELDLSVDELDACVESETPLAEIQEDIAAGRKVGVTGTPIFFVNGRKLADYRADAVVQVIDHILSGKN